MEFVERVDLKTISERESLLVMPLTRRLSDGHSLFTEMAAVKDTGTIATEQWPSVNIEP